MINYSDLDIYQKEIYDKFIDPNFNRNILALGGQGTGKSELIPLIVNCLGNDKVLVAAPTGKAAERIKGNTMHSIFGEKNINSDRDDATILNSLSKKKVELLTTATHLIIDEISMVRPDIFDRMEKVLKIVRGNETQFGGIKVLLIGDFFQLPPFTKTSEESNYVLHRYDSRYMFNSNAFKNGNFIIIQLKENHRQNDKEFIDALEAIKQGTPTDEQLNYINSRLLNQPVPDNALILFAKNEHIDIYNLHKLDSLPGIVKEYEYKRKDNSIEYDEADYSCKFNLKLKPNTRIMFVANDPKPRAAFKNGDLGMVLELNENSIMCSIDGKDKPIMLERMTFTKSTYDYGYDELGLKNIKEEKIKQFPIVLGYALSIHKAQGLTLSNVVVSTDGIHEVGQLYVALSRARSIEGLHLISKVERSEIIVSDEVIEFYKKINENNNPDEQTNNYRSMDAATEEIINRYLSISNHDTLIA